MKERYSRQILFPPIGEEGQALLKEKHVLIIGVGALGTQAAEMLTRAGIGQLSLVDRDYIEWSNLQRQYLFNEQDVENKLPKAIAAKRRLEKINSDVTIHAQVVDLSPTELEQCMQGVDLVLDATDNFEIRMITNDMCQKLQTPWIYGSCLASYGISYTIIPGKTPCLHCLLGELPMGGDTCDTAGIIQPAAAQVVIHQTTEALKLLTGSEESLRRSLISFDLWKNEIVEMDVSSLKKADCPSCSPEATYPYLAYEQQTKAALLCGRQTVQIRPAQLYQVKLNERARKLAAISDQIQVNPYLLSVSIDGYRIVLFKDGRALIHGTEDLQFAKSLYYRYLA